jgi:hypothetical protein
LRSRGRAYRAVLTRLGFEGSAGKIALDGLGGFSTRKARVCAMRVLRVCSADAVITMHLTFQS